MSTCFLPPQASMGFNSFVLLHACNHLHGVPSSVLTVGTGARSQRGISLWNFETQTQLAYEEYGQDTAWYTIAHI